MSHKPHGNGGEGADAPQLVQESPFGLYEYASTYYQLSTTAVSGYTLVSGQNYWVDTATTDCTGMVTLYVYYCSLTGDYYYTTSTAMGATLVSYGYFKVNNWAAFNSNPGTVTVTYNGVQTQFTPAAIYNAYNTSSGLNAFGNYAQINALNSGWTKYLTAAAFWLI
jgi:hypothetical protein